MPEPVLSLKSVGTFGSPGSGWGPSSKVLYLLVSCLFPSSLSSVHVSEPYTGKHFAWHDVSNPPLPCLNGWAHSMREDGPFWSKRSGLTSSSPFSLLHTTIQNHKIDPHSMSLPAGPGMSLTSIDMYKTRYRGWAWWCMDYSDHSLCPTHPIHLSILSRIGLRP